MKFSKSSIILTVIFFLELFVWIILAIATGHKAVTEGFLFDGVLKVFHLTGDILFVLGGLLGLNTARTWGGFKSSIGKTIIFISLGLITWGLGGFMWFWYLFYGHIEIPYPSLADVGFVLALPLWSLGVCHLAKATGAKFELRKTRGKIILFLVPILACIFSYYLLITIARGGMIDFSVNRAQLFFNLAYPLGDVLIFTTIGVIYLLSNKLLGGKYKKTIFTLFIGFIIMYGADFLFSYTTTNESYFNGNYVDMLFSSAIWVISVSINNLIPLVDKKPS